MISEARRNPDGSSRDRRPAGGGLAGHTSTTPKETATDSRRRWCPTSSRAVGRQRASANQGRLDPATRVRPRGLLPVASGQVMGRLAHLSPEGHFPTPGQAANSSAPPRPTHTCTPKTQHNTRTCIAHARARARVCARLRLSQSPGSRFPLLWRDPLASRRTLPQPGTGAMVWLRGQRHGLWKRGQTLRWRLAWTSRASPHLLGNAFSQLQGFLLFYIISALPCKNGVASGNGGLPSNSTHQQIPHTPISEHSDCLSGCLRLTSGYRFCVCVFAFVGTLIFQLDNL